MRPVIPLIMGLLPLMGSCRSHREVQSASQSSESVSSDIGLRSGKNTGLSAILSSDLDITLSDIDIVFNPPADTGGSSDPEPPTIRPGGAKAAPIPFKAHISRIDIKDRQNSALSAHTESADSLNAKVNKDTSDVSNEDTKSGADVFKPPAFLLILALALAGAVIIFILKQISKFFSK